MTFEQFEKFIKRNRITSIVLISLFVITTIFSINDNGKRVISTVKNKFFYEERMVLEVSGDSEVEKRLNSAKMEAVDYKIPSTTNAVIKFITLPILNNISHQFVDSNDDYLYSVAATLSPLKSNTTIFDGADCRIGTKISSFNKNSMAATVDIVSVSCTDNQGYAYSFEPKRKIGYVSEIGNPEISSVTVVKDQKYLTLDSKKKYYAQFFEPIEEIEKKGVSLFGRF